MDAGLFKHILILFVVDAVLTLLLICLLSCLQITSSIVLAWLGLAWGGQGGCWGVAGASRDLAWFQSVSPGLGEELGCWSGMYFPKRMNTLEKTSQCSEFFSAVQKMIGDCHVF